ncbi:MAG: polysaccharide deacetylase family protein [Telluria sp.]
MARAGTNQIHGHVGRTASGIGALACRLLLRTVVANSRRNCLSILIYHRVRPETDPLFPAELDARGFDEQMSHLKEAFTIISLGEAVERLRKGTLPPGAACITFDDGYADNVEIGLPILQRHGISATFFLASGFLDGGCMWNDAVVEMIRAAPEQLDLSSAGYGHFTLDSPAARQRAICSLLTDLKYLPLAARQQKVDAMCALVPGSRASNLMMTSEQVRILHRAGMEIGGHTVNHPIIARMDAESARQEILGCKEQLEAIIGAPVRWFAYPNGKPRTDYHEEHVEMVRSLGFDGAVSTAWGAASRATDPYQLPRFTPEGAGQLRFTLRMIANLHRAVEAV